MKERIAVVAIDARRLTVVLIGAAAQWEFTGMFERAGMRTFRVVGLIGGAIVTASFVRPVWEGSRTRRRPALAFL